MIYNVGPTGSIIKGHVLDVNKAALERAIKRYDDLLYLTWNPKKRQGLGCWELRRRAEKKTAKHQGHWNGMDFFVVDYPKSRFDEMTKDFETLDFRILDWVVSQDVFNKIPRKSGETDEQYMLRFHSELKYREAKHAESVEAKADEEMRYMIKQHRTEINELRELLKSGMNPHRLLQQWGRS